MARPPDDPNAGYRSDLPPLPRDERPVGYSAGWQIVERLQALGVVALGVAGLAMVYFMYTGVLPIGLPPPPQPQGLVVPVPTFNPAACIMPIMTISSVALIFVGFRRFIEP